VKRWRDGTGRLWKTALEGYTKVAEHFKILIPLAVLIDYLRGWLD
jgi:hypothetical protein